MAKVQIRIEDGEGTAMVVEVGNAKDMRPHYLALDIIDVLRRSYEVSGIQFGVGNIQIQQAASHQALNQQAPNQLLNAYVNPQVVNPYQEFIYDALGHLVGVRARGRRSRQ